MSEAIKDYDRIYTAVRQSQFGLKAVALDLINQYDANRDYVDAILPIESAFRIKRTINSTIRRYAKQNNDQPKVVPHTAFKKKFYYRNFNK